MDSGVEFLFDGVMTPFRGTLTVMSADNLAAWSIGGFKALASAFRKCQYCMVVDEDMQTKFTESTVQVRTKEVYMSHCEGLGGPLHDHIGTTYGVVSNSILNECHYFHVTNGLVPDIMHDILEGSLELCMRHTLIHLIREEKVFSLDLLNSQLSSFNYGPSEVKNKPTVIASAAIALDGHLKQSATQMWCLGRFLPLLIGHLVPEGDCFWENFLTLLTIMDYVFAPMTTTDKADYVAMLIEDFLVDFRELYPGRRLIPKMHYMIHLPTWMKWCGPLSRMWYIHYEAKHSYFKHLARVLGNFKNIAKTLSHHHQQYMCYQMSQPSHYLRLKPEYTGGKPVAVKELTYESELVAGVPELDGDSVVQRVLSVSMNGATYRKGVLVVCAFEEDTPMFGSVCDIVVSEHIRGGCMLIISPLVTVGYRHHYHAYEVLTTNLTVAFQPQKLIDYHPLVYTKIACNLLLVSVKYHLFS